MNASTVRSTLLEVELPSGVLTLDHVRVMGILNTTPDSFSDGGRYQTVDDAVGRASELVAEGADVIDIGGEKAGPGVAVTVQEELRRVIPVVEAVRREVAIPLSVDTFKPAVARAAVEAGVDIINSISGFDDPELRGVARDTGAAIVVMHIKGTPRVANPNPVYHDVTGEVRGFLEERVATCIQEGIPAKRIIIDPGPDFGKTTDQSVTVMRELGRLTELPYPVLLAASRKRFIGDVLGTTVDERLEGSLALVAWGVLQGVKLLRVHDVQASKRVAVMTEAVMHPDEVEALG
ncbi:MAG TPA: dihydropteroate synthase [Chloroflexota bacterium]